MDIKIVSLFNNFREADAYIKESAEEAIDQLREEARAALADRRDDEARSVMGVITWAKNDLLRGSTILGSLTVAALPQQVAKLHDEGVVERDALTMTEGDDEGETIVAAIRPTSFIINHLAGNRKRGSSWAAPWSVHEDPASALRSRFLSERRQATPVTRAQPFTDLELQRKHPFAHKVAEKLPLPELARLLQGEEVNGKNGELIWLHGVIARLVVGGAYYLPDISSEDLIAAYASTEL